MKQHYDIPFLRSTVDLMPLVEPTTTLRKVSSINGGEWAGPCPWCGGKDRFHVQPNNPGGGIWFCRQCATKWGDVIDFACRLWHTNFTTAYARLLGNQVPHIEQRMERTAAEIVEKVREFNKDLEILRKTNAHLEYHNLLTASSRALWRKRGISDGYQDFWQLGYSPDFRFFSDNTEHHSPTLTIPVFGPGWELQNIRHRILEPANPGDKYRPERSGVPAAPFVCNPDGKISGKILVVEGEIKSMVSFEVLDDTKLQAIGLPGKNSVGGLVKYLADCEPVFICLDPDARDIAYQLARDLGARARVIETPAKIDDMLTEYGFGKDWMENMMRTATRVA